MYQAIVSNNYQRLTYLAVYFTTLYLKANPNHDIFKDASSDNVLSNLW